MRALRGINLVVPHGTVLGVLGSNGAGKTTAVRILTTMPLPGIIAQTVTFGTAGTAIALAQELKRG